MAKNNFWDIRQGKVVPQPGPPAPNPSYPQVIILDPYAEGVTSYTLSYDTLAALETVYIVANATTIGTDVDVFLPALPSTLTSRKITVLSMSANFVNVRGSVTAPVNGDTGYNLVLSNSNWGTSANVTSATFIADSQINPSWYTIYNYFKP
jgi:hypothetical protein